MVAMRVISRMTDSVNVTVRLSASTRLSSDLAQCAPNAFGRAHSSSTVVDGLPHRALRIRTGIAERNQCANRVFCPCALDASRTGARASRNLEISRLVGDVENQLLRFFPSDTRHALQRRDALLTQRANEPVRCERRQKPERQRWTNSLGVEHPLKDSTLERAGEAEQLPGVFLHHEKRVQQHGLSWLRQGLVDAERDHELVGHAAGC